MGKNFIILLGVLMLGAGCSPASSSRPAQAPTQAPAQASPTQASATQASPAGPTTGPVLVSRDDIPTGVEYTVLGTVKANHRAGYDSVESLYPLLAVEARKLGANAVVGVRGGRTVSAFSWSAAFTSGTAVRIADPEALRRLTGSSY